ncbi:MAG: universal stress protein, partial [Halieaceae bacterium]|nr:universal stress protein [Halieaceae bacterium]
ELEAVVDPYRKRAKIETKILVGTPFLEIIREVLSGLHDLVVKMPENQHWAHRFFGSDDMHLLRKCPCPVWLIKPGAPDAYLSILAAVDVDDRYAPQEMETRRALNHEIIERAIAIAVADSAELHIAHAWQAVSESALRHTVFAQKTEKEVGIYVDQVRQHHNDRLEAFLLEVATNHAQASLDYLEPKIHLVKGWARQEIPALARNIGADLVVMGTVARTGIPGFIIGNTAETILGHLDCSVLAVKPPGFVTPVK